MRSADSPQRDFHLLEEIFQPKASVTVGRITVWIYRTGPSIREIVLSGHAEHQTCTAVSSILIEAGKQLDASADWMLVCGAAYFRLAPNDFLFNERHRILEEMVQALRDLAGDNGLIELLERNWAELNAFRESYRLRGADSALKIALPNPSARGHVADFMPITPLSSANGRPLILALEGWHFDCPEFQAVADRHLRKVQRELLRDALRRRRVYREWLRDWTDEWVRRLHCLPQHEADSVTLDLPGEDPDRALAQPVGVRAFLAEHVRSFVDRGQTWHRELAQLHGIWPFAQYPEVELQRPIHPTTITEVDFERGIKTQRPSTDRDRSFTLREQLTQRNPGLISSCLIYIRRMDGIIEPYEKFGKRAAGGGDAEENRKIAIVDEISRRIVLESMVRGWPSFYLDEKDDQDVFYRWAAKYREQIWRVFRRQMRAAGVAIELLLEDNVVYDVRFNGNLGCTLQPLMLADNRAHAEVHGARTGASAVVPLWSRRRSDVLPAAVLALGEDNRKRAARLVERARALTSAPSGDIPEAAAQLQLALACHPPEAGRLILAEWLRRLGRDRGEEFQRTRYLLEAIELFGKRRFGEAKKSVSAYLQSEVDPVNDAYVISALSDLFPDSDKQVQLRDLCARHDRLIPPFNELLAKVQGEFARTQFGMSQFAKASDVERLQSLRDEIEDLGRRIENLRGELKHDDQARQALIERALRNPASMEKAHPSLALAATKAKDELRTTLETEAFYARPSLSLVTRYGEYQRVIQVRALLDILCGLTTIEFRIGKNPKEARRDALVSMRQLAHTLWLPSSVETDVLMLAGEFEKGDWDRLQAHQIQAVLRDAGGTCLERMLELLRSQMSTGTSLIESLSTRIHLAQTLEAKYGMAQRMLLDAKVPLMCAVSSPWRLIDTSMTEFPSGARLAFDPGEGILYLQTTKSQPLLGVQSLQPEEIQYLKGVFADPDLPQRAVGPEQAWVDRLLAVEVTPRPEWVRWRDAMARVREELLCALSSFRFEANLMPSHSPPLTEEGEATLRRMNDVVPRAIPQVDWEWKNLGNWEALMGSTAVRIWEGY
jgi:hypothetical protein